MLPLLFLLFFLSFFFFLLFALIPQPHTRRPVINAIRLSRSGFMNFFSFLFFHFARPRRRSAPPTPPPPPPPPPPPMTASLASLPYWFSIQRSSTQPFCDFNRLLFDGREAAGVAGRTPRPPPLPGRVSNGSMTLTSSFDNASFLRRFVRFHPSTLDPVFVADFSCRPFHRRRFFLLLFFLFADWFRTSRTLERWNRFGTESFDWWLGFSGVTRGLSYPTTCPVDRIGLIFFSFFCSMGSLIRALGVAARDLVPFCLRVYAIRSWDFQFGMALSTQVSGPRLHVRRLGASVPADPAAARRLQRPAADGPGRRRRSHHLTPGAGRKKNI